MVGPCRVDKGLDVITWFFHSKERIYEDENSICNE